MGQVGKAPKWTPAQQRAIEDEGGTLLVSAAAGSGKTAVLVNRALRLICRREDPVPAEQLLIVTFTNAAAAELRSRLAKGLSQMCIRDRIRRISRSRMPPLISSSFLPFVAIVKHLQIKSCVDKQERKRGCLCKNSRASTQNTAPER